MITKTNAGLVSEWASRWT